MGKKSKSLRGEAVETAAAPASDPIDIEAAEEVPGADLDNPLRVVLVVNSPEVEGGDMEERHMDYVQTFEEVDDFFNEFDAAVAEPNESHIKYEVGSDGLVVMVVDSMELRDEVLRFIDSYNAKVEVRDEEEGVVKKHKS